MVQPAENISRSYPAIAWQLMAMDTWARPRPAVGIRNAWSQARVRSSPIVVGNPLPQDRPQMLLAQDQPFTHPGEGGHDDAVRKIELSHPLWSEQWLIRHLTNSCTEF